MFPQGVVVGVVLLLLPSFQAVVGFSNQCRQQLPCWVVFGSRRARVPIPAVFDGQQHGGQHYRRRGSFNTITAFSSTTTGSGGEDNTVRDSDADVESSASSILMNRLPTSVDDQIRQATNAIRMATDSGIYRHRILLLLPLIGATDLDDWPGGTPQQREASLPLVESILKQIVESSTTPTLSQFILDDTDGVCAIMSKASSGPKDDSCTLLLPTADTVSSSKLRDLDNEVGPKRNLILVNPQWRRRSDFGGAFLVPSLFGGNNRDNNSDDRYVEGYVPTFVLTNFICEGESIRVLRSHPGPWRVFVRQDGTADIDSDAVDASSATAAVAGRDENIDWIQIGTCDFIPTKPNNWENLPGNDRDGGLLFDFGQPSYKQIVNMLYNSTNYKPKNASQRAAAAFNFIKNSI